MLEARPGFVQVAPGQVALKETGTGEDHGQQVVEVVRHAGSQLADRFQALHLLQGGLDALALIDLLAQARIGFGQAQRGFALAGDVAGDHVKQGVFGHHDPRQPALLATGVKDAANETHAGTAVRERGQFGQQQFLIAVGQQVQQRRLAQALAGKAQAGFPGGVQRHRGEVLVQHCQQIL